MSESRQTGFEQSDCARWRKLLVACVFAMVLLIAFAGFLILGVIDHWHAILHFFMGL